MSVTNCPLTRRIVANYDKTTYLLESFGSNLSIYLSRIIQGIPLDLDPRETIFLLFYPCVVNSIKLNCLFP